MDELISSGHVVDLVLGVVLIEVLVFPRWSRRKGRVTSRTGLLLASLPGIFLLLALRGALTQAGWGWIALFLAASFPAHLADLWRRPP
jgi:hypothetical protein